MLDNLRRLREKRGWTQQKLAELLGTTQQNINRYETSETEPDISMLKKMADLFGVSIDFLVGYSARSKDGEELYPMYVSDKLLFVLDTCRTISIPETNEK